MQFNLVNDQEQVAWFVWRGVAWCGVVWRSVALHGVRVRVYWYFVGVPAAFVACVCIISVWCFSMASLGSSSGQRLLCILRLRLRMSWWLCLAQRSVCFPSLSLFRGVGASPQ